MNSLIILVFDLFCATGLLKCFVLFVKIYRTVDIYGAVSDQVVRQLITGEVEDSVPEIDMP